jgi:hypothetical protein
MDPTLEDSERTVQDFATIYHNQGLPLIRLIPRTKIPTLKEWSSQSNTPDEFDDENIAVRLDTLLDIDFDNIPALNLWSVLMLQSNTPRFGRPSKRMSHFILQSKGAANFKFQSAWQTKGDSHITLLELRHGSGQYTMFPPSIHPLGEKLRWEVPLPDNLSKLPEVPFADLKRRAGVLAFLADVQPLFAPHRHNELFMAICGALFAADYDEAEVTLFLNPFIQTYELRTRELDARLKSIGSQYEKYKNEGSISGLPKLVELLALDNKAEATWRKWLNPADPKKKTPKAVFARTMTILRTDPHLEKCFAYDEMLMKPMLKSSLPDTTIPFKGERRLEDNDANILLEYIQRQKLPTAGHSEVFRAMETRCREFPFHPVKEYLTGLIWDGKPRLDTMLSYYCEAPNSEYTRAVGSMFMIAMVARIFEPGCKVDNVLILEGAQGIRKSMFFEILADKWYRDVFIEMRWNREVGEQLAGAWLIELVELVSHKRTDVNMMKAFITRKREFYRHAYGRLQVEEARSAVFGGTTNDAKYLRDDTGNRRYWPVTVKYVDDAKLRADRDQIFAEAMVRYRNGEQWWPDDDFERRHITPEQRQREEIDEAWTEEIRQFLEGETWDGTTWVQGGPLERVTLARVATQALRIEIGRITKVDEKRIANILRQLGWEPHKGGKGRREWSPTGSIIVMRDGSTRVKPVEEGEPERIVKEMRHDLEGETPFEP